MASKHKNRAIVFISVEQVKELFLPPQKKGFVRRPIIVRGVFPETARCISVHDDYQRNGICCLLEDDSFPESELGEMLPVISVEWESLKIKVEEKQDGI